MPYVNVVRKDFNFGKQKEARIQGKDIRGITLMVRMKEKRKCRGKRRKPSLNLRQIKAK